LPASRRGPIQAAWDETSLPDASRACDPAAEARAWAVQPARGDREVSWDDRPPGELGAPLISRPGCPVGAVGGEDSVYRNAHPQGGVAVPAVQVVGKVADGVQVRGRRPVWDGPCYRAAGRDRQVIRRAGCRRPCTWRGCRWGSRGATRRHDCGRYCHELGRPLHAFIVSHRGGVWKGTGRSRWCRVTPIWRPFLATCPRGGPACSPP